MFVTEIGGKSVTGYAIFFEDCSVKVTISLETYTYINSRKEKDPENVFSVTLNNGLQFDVYMYGLKEKGQSSMVYASCVLANNAGYHQDELYYLNIDMDGHNVHWSSPADVAADLEDIVRKMRIANPYEEVYVPTAPIVEPAPAVEPAPIVEPVPAVEPAPAADDGKWICPSCNAENNGNFCANCGTKKPDGKWICPSCNAENSGNFCTNCGSKKP